MNNPGRSLGRLHQQPHSRTKIIKVLRNIWREEENESTSSIDETPEANTPPVYQVTPMFATVIPPAATQPAKESTEETKSDEKNRVKNCTQKKI